jgi:vibriolysin
MLPRGSGERKKRTMRKLLVAPMILLTASVAFGESIFMHNVNERATPGAQNQGKVDGREAARQFLLTKVKGNGQEDFVASQTTEDNLGQVHYKFQQTIKGLPVYGAEMIVHVDKASGNALIINGEFAADRSDLPRNPSVGSMAAIDRAAAQADIKNYRVGGKPELAYVVNGKGNVFLAWTTTLSYIDKDGDQLDRVFADATTGDLVQKAGLFPRLKNRATYSANNGTSLPGTLKRSEGSANIGDAAVDAAHNYAGNVYDYYKNVHNRDSYDNAGAQIKSSAHYSTAYNNAFWNGTQMVYGDGDGSQFTALSKALDVDAHELTHAVTERTAGLTYSNESGALNEATSDILGNSCEAYSLNGGTPQSRTWLVGEDIYTPSNGTSDALRYMNNPTADGYSKDYYPERITGTADNGGVHGNSGIANLAYYLMVMGGSHPRAKTSVVVPALSTTSSTSLDMAQRIWYRALTVYMTSSTNFSGARTATATAAADLYGGTTGAAYNTVQKAWDAVGAPGGTTPPAGTTTLSNGVAVTGISASTGTWKHYKITVPSGQSSLAIVMSGGTGDGDLYVKLGSQPTLSSYNYRPYLSGNNETVNVSNPTAGDWYISIYAYAAFSSVSLKATYSGTAPPPSCTSVSGSLSGTGASYYAPSTSGYASSISGTHTGKLTGPASGADFDLYLQKWNGTSWANAAAGESATATENVSYNGTAGTYRWRVYSYSGSGSFTLCTTKP